MNQNGVIKYLAIALAVAAMPVAALGVTFSINGQTNFTVLGDVHYHTGTGVVEFQASDRFFCFDFGSGGTQPGLTVKDKNDDSGVVLMNEIGLSSALQYRLGENEIRFQPSNATPCFFNDSSRGFGLFGDPSNRSSIEEEADPDKILNDQFQGFPELIIEYSPFTLEAGGLSVGDRISYSITIHNKGKVAMQWGAFQELATFGLLDTASLSCTSAEGSSSCGSAVPGNLVRFEDISLEPSGKVTLQISKTANQILDVGTEITFFSGVVSGDGNSSDPVFDSRVEPLIIP